MEDLYNKLLSLIKESKKITIFIADDIARKSGVPDYRKPHGSDSFPWHGIENSRLLSFDFLLAHPVLFYKWSLEVWYEMEKFNPNNVHYFISKLQSSGVKCKVYTEDIAMLCQKAGIRDFIELNGNTSAFCLKCGKTFSYDIVSTFVKNGDVPYCDRCGTILKPYVLLDEMRINPNKIRKWASDFKNCNLCILFGQPSTRKEYEQFIKQVNGDKLVIISNKISKFDKNALLKIEDIDKCINFFEGKI